MINRLIYNKEVYYKVNDTVLVFENKFSIYKIKKAIKEQGVETYKLKGFGNSIWIKENDLSMLEIDGAVTLMETKFICRKERLESHISIGAFLNTFLRLSNEEILEKALKHTDGDLDGFEKTDTVKDDNRITVETLNKTLEEFGYEERVVSIDVISEGKGKIEKDKVAFLVDNEDNLLFEFGSIEYSYREKYDTENFDESDYGFTEGELMYDSIIKHKGNWLRAEIELGSLYIGEDMPVVELTKGVAKNRNKKDVIGIIFNVLNEGKFASEGCIGDVSLEINGTSVIIDEVTFGNLLRGKFKITDIQGYNDYSEIFEEVVSLPTLNEVCDDKIYDDLDYDVRCGITPETFNERLKEFGYEERFIGIEYLSNDKKGNLTKNRLCFLVDNNNKIICDSMALCDYSDNYDSLSEEEIEEYSKLGWDSIINYDGDYLKAELSEGILNNDLDDLGCAVGLSKGEPIKRNENEIIEFISSVIFSEGKELGCDGLYGLILGDEFKKYDNSVCFSMRMKSLFDIITGKLKIIKVING